MPNENVEYFRNQLKDSIMSNWTAARSKELSVILEDCKKHIADNLSITSNEKEEQLRYLNKAYEKVVEELVGCE
ncbi:hypothetical protein [Sporosarcina sp.]|uniref:hypothetical protein n=1 Tax=Sporosarcina sp. TaxID=49982 RepID=UPI00261EA0E9|nr:hypothetical protein [Sporosarcina sp.]